ncbi:hypothetical protein L7F22_020018 [Adiantum nelumboides]|nr:hypothetical protein [Adiantum nelumboides]
MGGLCSRGATVDTLSIPASGGVDQGHTVIANHSGPMPAYNHSGPLPTMNQSESFEKRKMFLLARHRTRDAENENFENQADEDQHTDSFSSHLPLKALGGQGDFHRMFPNVPPFRVHSGSIDTEDFSEDFSERGDNGDKNKLARALSAKARSARSRTTTVAKKGAAKVNEVGVLLGRAGNAGLGKAVEALDTLGSSMTNLNFGSGFASGAPPKGNKIGILAFEVANTVVKGFNLKQSLSQESMKILKEEVFRSEGVQRLISTDTAELLRIAADDKRNELKIFSAEVVRFGNHCRDPQWHQLDRLFQKLDLEGSIQRQSREEAENEMQNLMTLAQYTAELYHELHALDRFETEYRRKLQEEELFNTSQRGDSLAILRSELKGQKKHVKNLKKKSLWSKILEEVMEKLVDIVYYLHQEIQNTFHGAGERAQAPQELSPGGCIKRLGPAGLSLHYANLVNQIDSLVSRPSSIPPNTRDNLYQGLPPSVKSSLRSKLNFTTHEELTIPQIKEEMERTLAWLVPVAANTTKAHHGFGWVGEWANTGSSFDQRLPGHMELTLLQTLHHAEQKVTEDYILELVVWLNHLVTLAKSNMPGCKSPIKSPIRSPVQQADKVVPAGNRKALTENGQIADLPELSPEDQVMLQGVKHKKFTPGISKSQEFNTSKVKAAYRTNRLSKSNSHSPCTSTEVDPASSRRHASIAPIDFETDRSKALDVIDRVDNI